MIAEELSAVGINVDFAPVLDVNNNPDNPIINLRSFSSDPDIVSTMGTGYILGLMNNNIIGSLKHFPGHGDTSTDSHTGFPIINKSYSELNSCEFVPFRAAASAGADMVMTAHIQYPQIETNTYTSITSGEQVYLPATLSKTILTDILRDDIGFNGVIVTDALEMDAVAKNFDKYDTAEYAINAGVDMLLMPVDPSSHNGIAELETYIDKIEEKVENNVISENRINESAERIVELKLKRNVWDYEKDVEAKVAKALSIVGSYEHHEKELEITNKAMTLIKNDDNTLPLAMEENDKVLFFYVNDNADKSFSFAFDRLKNKGIVPESASVEFIQYNKSDDPVESYADKIKDAKAVIIASDNWGKGEFDPATSSGSESKFNDDLTALTHSLGKKIIVVSLMYPYDAARFTDADAFLVAYGRKMMSDIPTNYNGEVKAYGPNLISAIITVFGGNTPTGKLPVDIYKIDGNYNYTDEILYGIGYGLTYEKQKDEPKPANTTPGIAVSGGYTGQRIGFNGSIMRNAPSGSSGADNAPASSTSSAAPAPAPAPAAADAGTANPDTGRGGIGALSVAALITAGLVSRRKLGGKNRDN